MRLVKEAAESREAAYRGYVISGVFDCEAAYETADLAEWKQPPSHVIDLKIAHSDLTSMVEQRRLDPETLRWLDGQLIKKSTTAWQSDLEALPAEEEDDEEEEEDDDDEDEVREHGHCVLMCPGGGG